MSSTGASPPDSAHFFGNLFCARSYIKTDETRKMIKVLSSGGSQPSGTTLGTACDRRGRKDLRKVLPGLSARLTDQVDPNRGPRNRVGVSGWLVPTVSGSLIWIQFPGGVCGEGQTAGGDTVACLPAGLPYFLIAAPLFELGIQFSLISAAPPRSMLGQGGTSPPAPSTELEGWTSTTHRGPGPGAVPSFRALKSPCLPSLSEESSVSAPVSPSEEAPLARGYPADTGEQGSEENPTLRAARDRGPCVVMVPGQHLPSLCARNLRLQHPAGDVRILPFTVSHLP